MPVVLGGVSNKVFLYNKKKDVNSFVSNSKLSSKYDC